MRRFVSGAAAAAAGHVTSVAGRFDAVAAACLVDAAAL